MSKYAFLRTKASFIIFGLLIGLFGGFKVANSQYRREQSKSLKAAIERGTGSMLSNGGQRGADDGHATAEVTATIEKARSNPNDAEAQMDAASQFIQIERPDEAMPFLEQANKVRPNDPRITAGLGVAYFMKGDLDRAATWLKRSRDLGATEPTVTSLLIGAYIQTGKNLNEADQLLKELELRGIDPAKLSQIRTELNAARAGSGASRSVLSHGPENGGGKK